MLPGEGGGGGVGSGSPRSSKAMERPLKEGWLKKQQRGLVKNWQQRYFVLRGTTLTYHKDKETPMQVSHRSWVRVMVLWKVGVKVFLKLKGQYSCNDPLKPTRRLKVRGQR